MTKNNKIGLSTVAAALLLIAMLVFLPFNSAGATGSDEPCVETPATAAVFGEWKKAGKVWTHDENAPVDPDGSDENSPTNLIKYEGPAGTKTHVVVEGTPATSDTYGPWTNKGGVVRTEENVAPSSNTEFRQWVPAGTVEEPVQTGTTQEFDYWQRYSWNGPWESNTEAPPFPDERWQPNVKGDPHGVGKAGAYFRSHGNSGNGDWFYLEAVTKEVPAYSTDVDYLWQKQVRVLIPGTPAVDPVQHTDYKWVKYVRTYTPAVPAVECPEPEVPETPSETPTTNVPVPTPTETVTVTPAVPTPTVTETVTPEAPAETVTETPEPTKTPEPKPEKDEPKPEVKTPVSTPAPPVKVTTSVQCEDGVFVTKVFKGDNLVSTSSAGSCGDDTEPVFSVGETGL